MPSRGHKDPPENHTKPVAHRTFPIEYDTRYETNLEHGAQRKCVTLKTEQVAGPDILICYATALRCHTIRPLTRPIA